jgi:hypothetical protein
MKEKDSWCSIAKKDEKHAHHQQFSMTIFGSGASSALLVSSSLLVF